MKKIKILSAFLFLVFINGFAHADVATVGYIHDRIYSQKSVTVPIDSGINTTEVSTTKYLLKQIDRANEILNGYATTNYAATGDFKFVNSAKVLADINSLVQQQPKFTLTVTAVTAFDFNISASGNFTINWGDGTTQTITKTNTNATTYSRTYAASGTYTIQFYGTATGYNSGTAAISFTSSANKAKITACTGSLGALFPTVSTVSPNFSSAFNGCTGLTSLPGTLFTGITGAPVNSMFNGTFQGCTGLTSLPSGLFSGITGVPKNSMFTNVFNNCSNITGTIPGNLFSGLSGCDANAQYLFASAFNGCSKITALGTGLFAGVSGVPAVGMFSYMFSNCNGLTTVPTGLFGTFTGSPAQNMFNGTFQWCQNLTTISNGIWNLTGMTNTNISGIFDNMFIGCSKLTSAAPSLSSTNSTKIYTYFTAYTPQTWGKPFSYCTLMSDYASIPTTWK